MRLCLAEDIPHILDENRAKPQHQKNYRVALTPPNVAWRKTREKESPLSTLTALGDLNNKKRWASEQTG